MLDKKFNYVLKANSAVSAELEAGTVGLDAPTSGEHAEVFGGCGWRLGVEVSPGAVGTGQAARPEV